MAADHAVNSCNGRISHTFRAALGKRLRTRSRMWPNRKKKAQLCGARAHNAASATVLAAPRARARCITARQPSTARDSCCAAQHGSTLVHGRYLAIVARAIKKGGCSAPWLMVPAAARQPLWDTTTCLAGYAHALRVSRTCVDTLTLGRLPHTSPARKVMSVRPPQSVKLCSRWLGLQRASCSRGSRCRGCSALLSASQQRHIRPVLPDTAAAGAGLVTAEPRS